MGRIRRALVKASKRRSDIGKDPHKDPRFIAAVDLVGRSGADQFKMWSCDEQVPIVYIAAALYEDTWECAAGKNPLRAVFRLCETVIDGGTCIHCGKAAGFIPDLEPTIANKIICWYQWDPELKTFRRGCEADGK
jgi:hypothetical protein